MNPGDKRLLLEGWIIRTPPFSQKARAEVGFLFRQLQGGASLSMPKSRPMPVIGAGCHELRVRDEDQNWRIVYFVSEEAVVVLSVFAKKTEKTPAEEITRCKTNLAAYLKRERR